MCSGLSAARSRQQNVTALETFLRPMLRAVVVLFDGGDIRRENDPRLLRRREDVDVGRQAIGLIERAYANKAHRIACAGVIAPQSDMAGWAAGDLLSLAAVRRRVYQFRLALQQDDAIGFDQRIQREGRS